VIGGVCAGISAYLDWDPLILRIIFAVLILPEALDSDFT
jgi:phage shock protein PspC (stress-responsive transcriptional regulator)